MFSGWEKRHVLWFATLDGAFGHLLPCSEKTYRRLLMLQNVLVTSIPHIAGLNPKNFRTLKQRRKELVNPSRAIIDGELVFKFTGKFIQEPIISKKIEFSRQKKVGFFCHLNRKCATKELAV